MGRFRATALAIFSVFAFLLLLIDNTDVEQRRAMTATPACGRTEHLSFHSGHTFLQVGPLPSVTGGAFVLVSNLVPVRVIRMAPVGAVKMILRTHSISTISPYLASSGLVMCLRATGPRAACTVALAIQERETKICIGKLDYPPEHLGETFVWTHLFFQVQLVAKGDGSGADDSDDDAGEYDQNAP
jgi:hypothetical protein